MIPKSTPYLSPEAYLAREREAGHKSEYFAGEVYPSDMRVKVSPTRLYTYPDVVVVCGEPAFDDAQADTLLNPTVVIEVLSGSTADYGRGRKFEHYRQLDSLQAYVLVAQEKCHVEHYARQPEGRWLLSETNDRAGVLPLDALGCVLALGEVYDRVELPPPPAAPSDARPA